ncbi:hypothetical protein [Streptomyces sp. C]|uniref:hypothetical protein n=1 Tax=Streptomyces sp. C TaxID=253839 RepID=UPI0001B4DC98|nr:hypothetical protein [Streptomyces sp. C]EFL19762.1 predicted protein [Streptomyces sp. C]
MRGAERNDGPPSRPGESSLACSAAPSTIEFRAQHNRLTSLPEAIGRLRCLRWNGVDPSLPIVSELERLGCVVLI